LTKGKLVTFEGIDGSGKSTQILKAYNHIRGRGVECRLFREPGGTALGESIRSILLSAAEDGLSMDGYTEFLLFAAARSELSHTIIKPLLESGCTVLLDRFADSSTAYQGYGRGVDLDFILRTNGIATGGISPDLTILFDIDPETALTRPGNFDDRIEKQGLDFFRRVRSGFLTLAKSEPGRFKVVDASRNIETIAREVYRCIDELLG